MTKNKPCLRCDKIIKATANWRLCGKCRFYNSSQDAPVMVATPSMRAVFNKPLSTRGPSE